MFSHVMFGVNELERSNEFYDTLLGTLGTLGIGPGVANAKRYFYRSPAGTFGITTPINGAPATQGNGSTLGFAVQSPEQGDAFHAAGVWPTAAQRVKTHQAFAKAPQARSIWRTCATQTATRSARCTGLLNNCG
jgi:catechol 2,3-dioxygenase-like lactoylglutathione lyase family enzyme